MPTGTDTQICTSSSGAVDTAPVVRLRTTPQVLRRVQVWQMPIRQPKGIRTPAASPANTLRQDLKLNDLRDWTPNVPMLLCGGNEDPEVFFFNTQLMQAYWVTNSPTAPVTVVDMDSSPTANDPYADEKTGFAAAVTAVEVAAIASGATDLGHSAVLEDYHAQLVPPFCLAAVKSFFDGH